MANYHNGIGSKAAGIQINKGFMLSFMQGGGQNAALKYLTDNAISVSVFLITGVKFDGRWDGRRGGKGGRIYGFGGGGRGR